MRLLRFLPASLLIFLATSGIAAHASVLYTFTLGPIGPFPTIVGTYSFLEPSILTSDTTILAASFLSFSGTPVNDIILDPTDLNCPNSSGGAPSRSCLEIQSSTAAFTQYYLSNLTSIGTYPQSHDSLVIATAASAATPEPAGFTLLGSGLLGLGVAIRRRLPKA